MTNITIGEFFLTPLLDGSMWFDGGAMFHVIPKPLWGQKVVSDEQNRMEVALNCMLIQHDETLLLIEAGAGVKFSQKQQQIFRRDTTPYLLKALQEQNVEASHINTVILTHLHKDHAGGLTMLDGEQMPVCVFPNAQHVVSKNEWDFANGGNELSGISYAKQDFLPVHEAGLLHCYDGNEYEIYPGITLHKTGGHTLGHVYVHITNNNEHMILPADIIPTRHHVSLNWTCSYDYCSYEVVEQKNRILTHAYETQAYVFLAHEMEYPIGHIGKDNSGTFVWKPVSL